MQLDAKRNTNWFSRNIYCRRTHWKKTSNTITKTNRWKNVFINTLYKWMQGKKLNKKHFKLIRVLFGTSVLLKQDRKFGRNWNISVRVAIEPSVQYCAHERKTWIEHRFHVPTVCASIHSSWQNKRKLQNLAKHSTTKATEKGKLKKQKPKKVFRISCDKIWPRKLGSNVN